MAIYDEFRSAFAKSSDEHTDYRVLIAQFSHQFAQGFQEYIGAPVSYSPYGKSETAQYVELCKVVGKPEGGQFELKSASFIESVTGDDDGNFTFGLRVVLERAMNAYPKERFGFAVLILPKGPTTCNLKIAGKTFDVTLTDHSTRLLAYDHMVSVLRKWLETKPWQVDQKLPIGFVHHEEVK